MIGRCSSVIRRTKLRKFEEERRWQGGDFDKDRTLSGMEGKAVNRLAGWG
jgi:hypothetical protein